MSKPQNTTILQRIRLQQFRQAIYEQVFLRARDALFELLDALLLSPGRTSFAELCLAAVFRRRWPSLYAAVQDGVLDLDALERVLTGQLPATQEVVMALDSTLWPHRQAKTLGERPLYPLNGSGREIVPGHAYSLLSWVVERGTSWALPVATRRIAPQATAVEVGAQQVKQFCQARQQQAPGQRIVIVSDGGYGNYRFLGALKGEACLVVARLRRDRVLYRAPGPYSGRGRPRKHGARFAFKDETTWGEADERVEIEDAHWGRVRLRRWNGLHAWQDAATVFDVIRIESHREREKPPQPLWIACMGGAEATAEETWRWYDQRWPIEPATQFRKEQLGWTQPRFQEEERCDRWTVLVTLAQWELYLARELVRDRPRPWQAPQQRKTPGRVQAGLGAIFLGIGTPAVAPQPRGKAPGWPAGRVRPRSMRHPVVRKSPRKRCNEAEKSAATGRAA